MPLARPRDARDTFNVTAFGHALTDVWHNHVFSLFEDVAASL